MTDSQKGAVAAPKTNVLHMREPEPHPLDANPPVSVNKRAEETRNTRRRREDMDYDFSAKLGVDHSLLDHSQFAYRWINDTAGRLRHFTVNDDWDIVRDPRIPDDKGHIEGAQVRHLAQTNIDGSPLYTYLCRKPLKYHNVDRAKKQRRTDELLETIKRGALKPQDGQTANQLTTYVPDGGISIEHQPAKVTQYKP